MASQDMISERILAHADKLSPQLLRAARYVAEHPDEVATRSLRYLAGVTNLQPATFSRMSSALGYANYEELREASRAQLKHQRLGFASKAQALRDDEAAGPEEGRFIVRHGSAAIDNINSLLNDIDLARLEATAARLAAARRVVLVGLLSSRPFVEYLGYMAAMAFDNWRVLGGSAESPASCFADLDQRDVVLVISKAPYARRTIEVAAFAKSRGVPVIGITDELMSPLCAHCDMRFLVATETPQFFSSHVATLVLIEALVGMVIAKSGGAVERKIEAVESTSHEMGEYVLDRSDPSA